MSTATAASTPNANPAKPRRVAMIVGDRKTLHCGVKDSANVLSQVLPSAGFTVDVMAPVSWRPSDVLRFIWQIREGGYDILHIQYPSIGHRYTLVPHILGLLRLAPATVVTLHEYSAFGFPQRLSTQLFRLSARIIFFGSDFERSRYNRRLGLLGPKQEVFPILSNVPVVPSTSSRDLSVVYFGQIRPNKGLEAFLELARVSVSQKRSFSFHVIGSISESVRGYALSLREQAPQEVCWSIDLPLEDVGLRLSRAFAAYLPFPDGVSERRGSLLAACLNGLPVLSCLGSATTPALAELILAANTSEEALITLDRLASSPEEWRAVNKRSLAYAEKHSWVGVARRHADTYTSLMGD